VLGAPEISSDAFHSYHQRQCPALRCWPVLAGRVRL
jgi:hypothetical protein